MPDSHRRELARGRGAGRRALLRAAGAIVLLSLIRQGARAVAAGDLKTVVIPVQGMVCFACAASVKRALKAIDGVTAVEVNLERRGAQVTYAPAMVTTATLVAAINKLGYRAGEPREVE